MGHEPVGLGRLFQEDPTMTLSPAQNFVLECFAAVALFAVGYGALWFGAAMGWW